MSHFKFEVDDVPEQDWKVVMALRKFIREIKQPITKADRIRAMSDEELATDLLSVFEEICEDGVPGKDWMLHWLKQPAEEGDGNG